MLGVRLREHHQLDIRGIAPQLAEGGHQVVDFIADSARPHSRLASASAACPSSPSSQRGAAAAVQRRGTSPRVDRYSIHTVSVMRSCNSAPRCFERRRGQFLSRIDEIDRAALQPRGWRLEAADMGDIRGLARPGRFGAEARRHQNPSGRARRLLCAARRSAACLRPRVRFRSRAENYRRSARQREASCVTRGIPRLQQRSSLSRRNCDSAGAPKAKHAIILTEVRAICGRSNLRPAYKSAWGTETRSTPREPRSC
jgi:hypothetical protein